LKLAAFASRFALAGAVAPLLVEAAWFPINHTSGRHNLPLEIAMQKLTLILWPTSLQMGVDWGEATLSVEVFLISAVLNALLFGVVGVSLWFGLKRHRVLLLPTVLAIGALWGWLLML